MTLTLLPALPEMSTAAQLADAATSGALLLLDTKQSGMLQARARQVEACVAQVFRVPHEALRASTRGKADVARARQVAMYVCHTTLGFSLTQVGLLFERDRTTVGHACRVVEDLRDRSEFDAMIICLERTIMAGYVPAPFRAKVAAGGPSITASASIAGSASHG